MLRVAFGIVALINSILLSPRIGVLNGQENSLK